MKSIITFILFTISIACFAQAPKNDTISVQSNAIQLERLNKVQERLNADEKEFNDLLELIFGAKIEEVEWWVFKQGKFLFILKPKPNGKKTD